MSGFDRDGGVNLQVSVDDDQVAHFSRVQVVNVADAGSLEQRLANRRDFDRIRRSIHQVVQGPPSERPAHFGNEKADDERRDRIENRVTGQIAEYADPDNQR